MSLRTWFKIIFIEPQKNAYNIWSYYSRMATIVTFSFGLGVYLSLGEWLYVLVLSIGAIGGMEELRRNIKRLSIKRN